jgi:hypothetical protein
MDERVLEALRRDRTIDITTTGARSGRSQRIEIWAWKLDGKIYLTGSPGRRDWYANLKANPEFTYHLKQSAVADLPARARPIEDPAEKRAVLEPLLSDYGRPHYLDGWLERSPLVEVELAGLAS